MLSFSTVSSMFVSLFLDKLRKLNNWGYLIAYAHDPTAWDLTNCIANSLETETKPNPISKKAIKIQEMSKYLLR